MKRRAPAPAIYVVFTTSRQESEVRADLRKVMRVLDSGVGTVEDPSALWFEVTSRDRLPGVGAFVGALTAEDVLRVIETVEEGSGKDMAKQLPLLPRRQNGHWSEGVVCGRVPPPVAEVENVQAGQVSQMPLFDEM